MARRAEPVERRRTLRGRERVAAFRLGLSAESRAAMLLIAKGYRIAARRWKTPLGEIDIVARRRRALIFVEVKARERARRRGASRNRARAAADHRRRRALARPSSGRRRARDPLRRDPGRARQDAAAHCQRLRCYPLNAAEHGGRRRQNCVDLCLQPDRCPHSRQPRSTDAPERRRADGPDRADQCPRRFDLRLVARSATPRPRPRLLHARPAGAARRQSVRHGAAARGARPSRRAISRSASRATPSFPHSTWCCCARTRRSISPTSPRRTCSSASTRRRWWSTTRRMCATRRKRSSSPNFPT